MSPFEAIDNLTVHKTYWKDLGENDKKSVSIFMINRILSMNQDYIEFVDMVQRWYNMPIKTYYDLWAHMLPSNKFYYKYIKKTEDKYNKDLVEAIKTYYEVSASEAKTYIDRLSKESLENILYSTGYDQKQIKKMVK